MTLGNVSFSEDVPPVEPVDTARLSAMVMEAKTSPPTVLNPQLALALCELGCAIEMEPGDLRTMTKSLARERLHYTVGLALRAMQGLKMVEEECQGKILELMQQCRCPAMAAPGLEAQAPPLPGPGLGQLSSGLGKAPSLPGPGLGQLSSGLGKAPPPPGPGRPGPGPAQPGLPGQAPAQAAPQPVPAGPMAATAQAVPQRVPLGPMEAALQAPLPSAPLGPLAATAKAAGARSGEPEAPPPPAPLGPLAAAAQVAGACLGGPQAAPEDPGRALAGLVKAAAEVVVAAAATERALMAAAHPSSTALSAVAAASRAVAVISVASWGSAGLRPLAAAGLSPPEGPSPAAEQAAAAEAAAAAPAAAQQTVQAPAAVAVPQAVQARHSEDVLQPLRDLQHCHQKALLNEDPSCIFIVQQITRLGHRSREVLRIHYSQYGKVNKVLTAHSMVKPSRDSSGQQRVRPGGLGLIAMASWEGAERALAAGKDQVVAGCTIRVERFEPRKIEDAGLCATFSSPSSAATPGSRGAGAPLTGSDNSGSNGSLGSQEEGSSNSCDRSDNADPGSGSSDASCGAAQGARPASGADAGDADPASPGGHGATGEAGRAAAAQPGPRRPRPSK